MDSSRNDQATHRENVRCKSALDARVKTCLAFRDESDPRASLVGVRDQTAVDRRTTHPGLLCPLPAVWVAENELDGVFDGLPHGFAVCMGIDDEAAGAAEQVMQKVAKHVDGGFVARKAAEPHSVHVEFHGLGPQTQLESVRGMRTRWQDEI